MMTDLEHIIGYKFHTASLLQEALAHPSITRGNARGFLNNQRLEFLGDAVLSLVVSRMLFETFPQDNEGGLAKRHAALVCRDALAMVAEQWRLGEFLHMSDSEIVSGGRQNVSNLEDACEALIGAIYLDSGIEAVETLIIPIFKPMAEAAATPPKDAKSTLQEWAQGRGLPLPHYQVISTDGPAHAPQFTIEAVVEGYPSAQASANSKRSAEQIAAKLLLEQLGAASD